jgi:hypothetical protein
VLARSGVHRLNIMTVEDERACLVLRIFTLSMV